MTEHVAVEEEYLLVEEVADRLGLPLSVLMRRVEAGDIPALRIENENGVHYSLRLSDLGIENGPPDAAAIDEGTPSGMDVPHEEAEGMDVPTVALTGRRVAAEDEETREPSQPTPPHPSWFHTRSADHDVAPEHGPDDAGPAVHQPAAAEPWRRDQPAAVEDVPAAADDGSPVPAAIIAEQRTPHGDLSAMSLDARELVAGLLDRWERTLEQRIYTEQRQRFQGELTARQTMVKQLQMELHTVRAEHAAAQAEKDRHLAEKERELADRDRQLADARRLADETERLLAPAASARRRRWFWHRDD